METQLSPTKRGTAAPTFEIYGRKLCLRLYNPRPMSIVAKRLDGFKMTFNTEVGLGAGHIVYAARQFSAPVYCGQTAGWIKMKFGTQVGLGPGDIVLDGGPASPPPKGHSPTVFGPYLLWPNGRQSRLLLSTCIFIM